MMAQIVVAGAADHGPGHPAARDAQRLHRTPLLIGMVAYEAVLAASWPLRLQLAAQQVLSPTYAALVYTLEPVVAATTSLLLTGDRLTLLQWRAALLIIAGSLLPELRRGRFTRS